MWMHKLYKPAWQLAALDIQHMSRGGPAAQWSVPWRSAGLGRERTVSVTADTVIKLCEHGQLIQAVEAVGILVQTLSHISQALFYGVLKTCVVHKNLVLGRRVHALTVRQPGYVSGTFLCNHILRMYAAHGKLPEAMQVFTDVVEPDAFTWSAIISAHVQLGQDEQAIQLYNRMRMSSVKPDNHVFLAALQACAKKADLKIGQQVHADVLAAGVEPDSFVCNCLVDMYAKCGSLEDARKVFDGLGKRDVVTWTALISGYSQQGMGQDALRVYRAMQEEGMAVPDYVTFLALLQACATVGALAFEEGKELHVQIGRQGLKVDVVLGCSLVSMYAKCGSLEDAQAVFNSLGHKDVAVWTALMAGYADRGMGQEALRLHGDMQEEGIAAPTSAMFVCLLQACASVGSLALEKGRQLHLQIREQGLELDVVVGCSVVNMYAKCGSLEDAQRVFDVLGQKDVVTWTALIAGYSQQGMGQEALRLYGAMQNEGMVAPDSVTFVCLLHACANVAALHLGRQIHAQIVEQGLHADKTVGNSLVNMYAKSGSMVDAQCVFEELPERDDVAWNALIAGYTRQGDSELVFDLLQRMREDGIHPAGVTFLNLLAVCSHTGLVNKGREYFKAMSRQYGVTPTADHYTCMVDLLGRAGHLDEAVALVRKMPVLPDAAVWRTLLGACQKWSNVEVGRHAFDEVMKLDRTDSAAYVLMANIYIGEGMLEQAKEVQARRTGSGAWKQPGQSWWTDLEGQVHSFLVGDPLHMVSGVR